MGEEGSGFGFGSRPNPMETIGEGEEEDILPTLTQVTRANSLDNDKDPAPEPIRGLRLFTRTSFSEGHTPSPEPPLMASSDERPPVGRSLSQGEVDRARPRSSASLERSLAQGLARRPSVGRPGFERGTGNPLFPSNFGQLSIGPTLAANNPTLRYQSAPLPSAYSVPRRYTHIDAEPPSFLSANALHRRPLSGSNYAVTIGSGSSDRSSVVSDGGQSHK